LQFNDTCCLIMYFFHLSCIHTYVIVKIDCTFVVSFTTMYNMWCLLCHKTSLHFFFCIFWSFIGWKKSCSLTLEWCHRNKWNLFINVSHLTVLITMMSLCNVIVTTMLYVAKKFIDKPFFYTYIYIKIKI
jgi:hypothetical protein